MGRNPRKLAKAARSKFVSPMALKNGGETLLYAWGQTLEEVTVRLNVEGLRAKELSVSFSRCRLTVTNKATGQKLLAGELQQPIICEDSSWMMEDGEMLLQLAKDNKRAENERDGPSSEWWLGVLKGEDSIDSKDISVEDYVQPEQLPPEQREQAAVRPARLDADLQLAEQHAVRVLQCGEQLEELGVLVARHGRAQRCDKVDLHAVETGHKPLLRGEELGSELALRAERVAQYSLHGAR